MKTTVNIPIYEEKEIKDIIPQIKQLGEICKKVKIHYPSVWRAINSQYRLDTWGDKVISDELFERKLELFLLQDDELRKT